MFVRQLQPDERFEAQLIATVAFHGRIDDPEKARQEAARYSAEQWGAFTDSGEMMASIVNNHFTTRFDGTQALLGGVGGVSTLPEYRVGGAIRAIFLQLLPHARERGEILSALYPFYHAFYRKFGYETACQTAVYSIPPRALQEYRFEGEARLWKTGDAVSPYTDLYNRFSSRFNLSMVRDDDMTSRHVRGEYYKDRRFCYLLKDGGRFLAYVVFQDVRHDPMAILKVEDVAWDGGEGFRALLGFLSRFSADYGEIALPLPNSIELFSVIHSPDAYNISKTLHQSFMVRPVDAPKLLASLKMPEGAAFTVQVSDDILTENSGIWRVTPGSAEPARGEADIALSIQALGILAVGAVSLGEAALREDVSIRSNRAVLESVFTRKPIFVQDHF